MQRLQIQLMLIASAGLLTGAASWVLIHNVIRTADGVVSADARRQLSAALAELVREFGQRDPENAQGEALAPAARDLSLRAVSAVVLRSYPGVEGGYAIDGQLTGYSFPTHRLGAGKTDVPPLERQDIEMAAQQAVQVPQSRLLRGARDVIFIEAAPLPGGSGSAWVMKRVADASSSGERQRNIYLGILVGLALAGIVGALSTALQLNRGLRVIRTGLARMEEDFNHRLPGQTGEMGVITAAINQMATTRQRLEAALRREERLKLIGRLVSGVAHEIRNPLNSLRLSVELLERLPRSEEVMAQQFSRMKAEVDRLSNLLTGLLKSGTQEPPALRHINLSQLIEETIRLLEPEIQAKALRVVTTLPPGVTANLDGDRFRQALMNVLLNAIDATPAGSVLRIDLTGQPGAFSVVVSDSGGGVLPQDQERLFEPFYSSKPGGTGLGLAISRDLMSSMGGGLTFEGNGINGLPGAVFSLRLPRAEGA